jgi:hypothetical protein
MLLRPAVDMELRPLPPLIMGVVGDVSCDWLLDDRTVDVRGRMPGAGSAGAGEDLVDLSDITELVRPLSFTPKDIDATLGEAFWTLKALCALRRWPPSGDSALVDGRGVAAAVAGAVCDFGGPFLGRGKSDFRFLCLCGSQSNARLERSRVKSSFPGGPDGLLRLRDRTLLLPTPGDGTSSVVLRVGGLSMSIDLL